MNRIVHTVGLIAIVFLAACEKEPLSSGGIISELEGVEYIVQVSSSNYERLEIETLERPDRDLPFKEGIIEYWEEDNLVAQIDFGNAEVDKARYMGRGGDKEIDLVKDHEDDKSHAYKKVIVEPLVKADDCPYIVAGIIDFYDLKTGDWVASFDYGDGTCDEFILKTTEDGNFTFSMNDYPEWN